MGHQAVLIDRLHFIRRFFHSPATIGAIFPSSSRLTKKILRHIPNGAPPRRYLEIGAGTGVFTDVIIKKLKPHDHLDVVELDHELCEILKRKFRNVDNVSIYEMSILDFHPRKKYDAVISSLPLTTNSVDFVSKVLNKYCQLTKDKGYVSYFEYIALPKIKLALLFGRSHRNFSKILALKQNFVDRYGKQADGVWLNFTPALVHHCQIKGQKDR
jgi:phosphatidylethanolamine/phosphatidyl-N-methylethanolamine N-methyltransferase